MMKKLSLIPAGKLISVSTGDYSDYIIRGVFKALKDIDPGALRDEWLAAHPEESKAYSFDEHAFFAWVHSLGLIEEVRWQDVEWHLTSYSSAAEMRVYP